MTRPIPSCAAASDTNQVIDQITFQTTRISTWHRLSDADFATMQADVTVAVRRASWAATSGATVRASGDMAAAAMRAHDDDQ